MEWLWLYARAAFLSANVTKTGDAYGVPLNRTALQVIEERRDRAVRHTKLVFLNRGQPWTKFTYYRRAGRGSKALGCWSNGSKASAAYVHFDVEALRPFAEKLDVCLGFVSPDSQAADDNAVNSGPVI